MFPKHFLLTGVICYACFLWAGAHAEVYRPAEYKAAADTSWHRPQERRVEVSAGAVYHAAALKTASGSRPGERYHYREPVRRGLAERMADVGRGSVPLDGPRQLAVWGYFPAGNRGFSQNKLNAANHSATIYFCRLRPPELEIRYANAGPPKGQ